MANSVLAVVLGHTMERGVRKASACGEALGAQDCQHSRSLDRLSTGMCPWLLAPLLPESTHNSARPQLTHRLQGAEELPLLHAALDHLHSKRVSTVSGKPWGSALGGRRGWCVRYL